MEIEECKIDLAQYSIHTVAGLLNAFLLDLDPPLFTYELYDIFIAVTGKHHLKKTLINHSKHSLIRS